VHTLCGQAIELVLKASVASRTLDNITGVLIAFKNFRKTIKSGVEPQTKGSETFRQQTINQVLQLPNGDLQWEDIERPGGGGNGGENE